MNPALQSIQQQLVLTFLLTALFQPISGQWTVVHTAPTRITDVATAGPNKVLGLSSEIAESTDGGLTWTSWNPTVAGGGFIGVLQDLYFKNDSDGFVVGSTNLDAQYLIMQSSDGGHDWQVSSFSNTGMWPRRYNAISFASNFGLACGTNGRLVKTANGGSTWSTVNSPTTAELIDVRFLTQLNAVVMSKNQLWRSNNGGTLWYSGFQGSNLGGLDRIGSTVFAAADNKLMIGANFGAIWTTMPAPFTNPTGVHAVNPDTIYVSTQQGLFVTKNGGANWGAYLGLVNTNLNDVVMLSDSIGIAGGQNGDLHRTGNGGGVAGPIAVLAHNVTYYCDSAKIQLSNYSDPGLNYWWTFNNDTLPSTSPIDYWLYDSLNVIDVVLTVNDGLNSGTNSWEDTLYVQQAITVDAGPDVTLCLNEPTLLQASGATDYMWTPFTDLSSPLTDTTTFFGLAPATYVVRGETPTGGRLPCVDTDTVEILAMPPPPAGAWSDIFQMPNHYDSYLQAFSENAVLASLSHSSGNKLLTLDGGATVTVKTSPCTRNHMYDPFIGYCWGGNTVESTVSGWDTSRQVLQLPGPNNISIVTVNAPDPFTAYVVWRETFVNGSCNIYRTDDQGNSWSSVFQSNVEEILELQCSSKDHCIAPYYNGINDSLFAYVTEDGWNSVQSVYVGPLGHPRLNLVDSLLAHLSISFSVNALERYVATTNDGGYSWDYQDIQVGNDQSAPITLPVFADSLNGMIAGKDRDYFWTDDGGQCWLYELGGWPTSLGSGSSYDIFLNDIASKDGVFFRTIFDTSQPPATGRVQRLSIGSGGSPLLSFNINPYSQCDTGKLQLWNTSTGYLNYEWLLNGTPVSTDYAPLNIQPGTGSHVLSLVGFDISGSDTIHQPLTVQNGVPGPLISQPVDVSVLEGLTATFQFTSSLTPDQIVWFHDSVAIPGSNSNLLTLPNVSLTDIGSYHAALIYSGCGGNTVFFTNTAQLTVTPTGANEPAEVSADFQVGPVPFTDQLNVAVYNSGVHYLRVFTMEGRLILEREWMGSSLNTINTSALPNGAYVLQISDEKDVRNSVVIKVDGLN